MTFEPSKRKLRIRGDAVENVAKRYGISTSEQHDVALRRLEQYPEALSEDQAFQHRYMRLAFEIPKRDFKIGGTW